MSPRTDHQGTSAQTPPISPVRNVSSAQWSRRCLGLALLSIPAIGAARPGPAPDVILPADFTPQSASAYVRSLGDDTPSRRAMAAVASGSAPTIIVPGKAPPRTRPVKSARATPGLTAARRRAVRSWPAPPPVAGDVQVTFDASRSTPPPTPAATAPVRRTYPRAQRMLAAAASGTPTGMAAGATTADAAAPVRKPSAIKPVRRAARRMFTATAPAEAVPVSSTAAKESRPTPVQPAAPEPVAPNDATPVITAAPRARRMLPADATPPAATVAAPSTIGDVDLLAGAPRIAAVTAAAPHASAYAETPDPESGSAQPDTPQQPLSIVPDPEAPSIPLRPYEYVPSSAESAVVAQQPQNTLDTAQSQPQRPPEQQRLMALSLAGHYSQVGREGLALMKREKVDDELRFNIANALAWSGRLHDAERVYGELLDTPRRLDAQVAMANIQRWRGKDALAAAGYRSVLAAQPGHAEARHGLDLTERALRPRLLIESTTTGDYGRQTILTTPTTLATTSSTSPPITPLPSPFPIGADAIPVTPTPMPATAAAVPIYVQTRTRTLGSRINYRWTTDEGMRVWEAEVSTMHAKIPGLSAGQALLTGRMQAHDLPTDPAFEVSLGDRVYLMGSFQPSKRVPVRLHAGNVNWGQMVFNARALDERLSAVNVGLSANFDGRAGRLGVLADHYQIDDGNNMQTALVRYTPPFKLISRHLRPVLGIEHRKARYNSPSYWSPVRGYGAAFAGIEGDWSDDRWSLAASVQRGWRLYGEAGASWGASLSGSYDFGQNWTAGARAWVVRNRREDAPYRGGAITLFVEHRW